MKTTLIILIVLLALMLIYIQGRSAYNRVYFSFSFKGVDLGGLSITEFIAGEVKEVNIKVGAIIKNDNRFPISFTDLSAKLYYEGVLISETTDKLANRNYKVPAKGSLEVLDTVSVYLNSSAKRLVINGLLKKKPKINYIVTIRVFKIPITFESVFIWE